MATAAKASQGLDFESDAEFLSQTLFGITLEIH